MSLAYSHVHLQADPVRFNPDGQIFVDDAQMVLTVYRQGVFIVHSMKDARADPKTISFVNPGDVLSVKFSSDHRFLSLQRSSTEIEIVNLKLTTEFRLSCKSSKGNEILGVVWINNDIYDLCLICTTGLELYKMSPKADSMKLSKHIKQQNNWFLYSHPNRLLMLCAGKEANAVQCYQFPPNGLIKMRQFMPDTRQDDRRLQPQDFVLSKLYDKLCCIFINGFHQELIVYQLGRDAVARHSVINLYTACDRFAVSVIDNLLVVHNTDSQITMLFDIHSKNKLPVAAPLPLGGPPSRAGPSQDAAFAPEMQSSWEFVHPSFLLDKASGCCWSVALSLEHLSVSCSDKPALLELLLKRSSSAPHILRVIRNVIQDQESINTVSRLFNILNAAFSASLKRVVEETSNKKQARWWFWEPDTPPTDMFLASLSSAPLSGARGGAGAAAGARPGGAGYLQGTLAAAARQADAPPLSSGDFGGGAGAVSSAAGAAGAAAGEGLGASDERQVGPEGISSGGGRDLQTLVDQTQILEQVLSKLHDSKQALPVEYFVAVVTEYMRSLHKHALVIEPFLFEFLIKLLVTADPPLLHLLHQFVQYHVVQDSKMVARQLLAVEEQYPPALQLSLDMLHRLGAHEEIVDVLVVRGKLVLALQYVRTHNVSLVNPSFFLKAAVHDDNLFYTVFRFLESNNQALRGTPAFMPLDNCDEYVQHFRRTFPQAINRKDVFAM
mmetsp:Transcript_30704/g.70779  ORF Transcript_30704/g.70779 Transcript_30704/m.70779 type:complete len:723 (+) Transcript_30704:80-2248(+)